jgi:hypothetical protein
MGPVAAQKKALAGRMQLREGCHDVGLPGVPDQVRARDPKPPGGGDETCAPVAEAVT